MTVEESPEEFSELFAEYATRVDLLPLPVGYPLLEALTPIGVVLAMDRCAPPAPTGQADVIFHAVCESFSVRGGDKLYRPLPRGASLLRGRVVKALSDVHYLFDVGVHFVLGSYEPLEAGLPLEIRAAAPLMAFRLEASGS